MDKFDIFVCAVCIGTIVAGAVFGTWALFMTMSLQGENKMTRKHFEIVAAAISNIVNRPDRWLVANMLADSFEKENPRFDRDRFITACRPTEGAE